MSKPSKKSLDAILSALPDKKHGSMRWTMTEDAAILKYADSKGIPAIAEALGKPVAATRYRFKALQEMVKRGQK